MFCFECGTNIAENSKFCPKCGTPVNIETAKSAEINVGKNMRLVALASFILMVAALFLFPAFHCISKY